MNDGQPRFLPTELVIGVPELDTQHEALFSRLAFLKGFCLENKHLPVEQAEDLLNALREHYAAEERVAREKHIDFSEHARLHEVMLVAVSKTLKEVVAGRTNVFSLLRYLDYWFERHIIEEDIFLGNRHQLAKGTPGTKRAAAHTRADTEAATA